MITVLTATVQKFRIKFFANDIEIPTELKKLRGF